MIGERLGRYIIEEEVGQGGMSVVYKARDTVLNRTVAVKVLHPHLSNREESRRRFQREAQAVARLSHPNITQVFDFSDEAAERSYIVMEFIDGGTLRRALDEHPPKHPEIAALLTVKLCEALQHAHAQGIIHRDIKPENVMLCQGGALKITDFGIAQVADAQGMTVTGALVGSPAHMSPEMIEGHDLDARADLFSLGTVLYFAATGALPFQGRNAPMVLKAIAEGTYLDAEVANPRVGRKLARIIDTCLALQPQDRYPSALDLRDDLLAWLAEVGLDNPDAELRAYFHDPDAYEDALHPRLLDALERQGARALDERRIGAATEYFNRALALEPEHPRILKLIRRIDQRRKLFVYLAVVAAVLLTASAILAVASLTEDSGADPLTQPPDTAAAAIREASITLHASINRGGEEVEATLKTRADDAQSHGQRRGADTLTAARRLAETPALPTTPGENPATSPASARPPEPARDAGRPPDPTPDAGRGADLPDAPPDAPPVQEITVTLSIYPPNATVNLGGRTFTDAEVKRGVRVPFPREGRLRAEVTHEACFTTTLRLTLPPDSNRVDHQIRLRWRPAQLRVESADPKATILVFDAQSNQPVRSDGVPNVPISVPILDTVEPQRLVRVSVLSGGRSHQYKDIRLEAGKTHVINAAF